MRSTDMLQFHVSPLSLHSRYNYLAVARVSRADPVAWWWNKEKGGGTGASRDKVSRSPPGAVSPTKESPWENGRPSSQVTFSSHRRPSTVPLAFSFFSFFFSFPYSSPSVRGPLEKSKRRKEFPWDREAFSFSAGLYQDTLGLRRNLGFCNGGTLNGVPTFSCWRDHLICIMLLVLLGWRCLRVAGLDGCRQTNPGQGEGRIAPREEAKR